mmetsp:Transcript_121179/g.287852  ORF Transcript_121179/g.287852 Transcript_121179/m.287852 type:complete len:265 (+) Transcript_121179:1206-2000(+)
MQRRVVEGHKELLVCSDTEKQLDGETNVEEDVENSQRRMWVLVQILQGPFRFDAHQQGIAHQDAGRHPLEALAENHLPREGSARWHRFLVHGAPCNGMSLLLEHLLVPVSERQSAAALVTVQFLVLILTVLLPGLLYLLHILLLLLAPGVLVLPPRQVLIVRAQEVEIAEGILVCVLKELVSRIHGAHGIPQLQIGQHMLRHFTHGRPRQRRAFLAKLDSGWIQGDEHLLLHVRQLMLERLRRGSRHLLRTAPNQLLQSDMFSI